MTDADIKGHILYDSIYMKCPEQANLLRQKVIGSCLGLEGSRVKRAVTADGYGVSLGDDGHVPKSIAVLVEPL